MMKDLSIIMVVLVFITCFFSWAGEIDDGGLLVGSKAPDWTLKDADGNTYSLSDFKGKVILLDFWATWCEPCVLGMPGMQKISEDYTESIVVIGMNFWDDPGEAVAFFKKKGYTYLMLLETESLDKVYNITGIPSVFLIGIDGTIVHYDSGWGESSDDEYREVLKAYLKEISVGG